MSNMNPAPRRGAPQHGRSHGNLRRDINLLPVNEGTEKAARWGSLILYVVLGAALFFGLAMWLPTIRLNDLKSQADNAEAQVEALQSAGAQFNGRVSERNAIQGVLSDLEKSGSDLSMADIMDQISQACPDSVTLYSVKISETGANIAGRAPDDRTVAQFIDNLKTIPAYETVRLSSVNDVIDAGDEIQTRAFEISAEYPPPATPTPQPTATPAAGKKGGDGA
jgi:Tfp pilus assembly protein PilN